MIDPERSAEVMAEVGEIRERQERTLARLRRFDALVDVGPDCALAPEQLDVVSPFAWPTLGRLRLRVVSWAKFELN